MAHIISETVTITFSRVFKGNGNDADEGPTAESLITDELLATLESVAQELVGTSVVVEVNGI